MNEFTTAEKQLISTFAWFRSRYALFVGFSLDRKADKQGIETFGQIWMGSFMEDWADAFNSLCEKNILRLDNDEYALTDYGNTVKDEIELKQPFYKYEYDNFFQLERQSQVHGIFCKEVYGLDLSQHGLIDQAELSILTEMISAFKPKIIIDIGCGNGKITEWIAEQTRIACVGIDISSEAINNAKERTNGNQLLNFEEGNMNCLKTSEKYDAALFLDTLYYSNNLKVTISQTLELLQEGGRVYAYFSQWIMDEAYRENLKAENTHLAKVLNELKLDYSSIDLSESGRKHWRRKLEVLNKMEKDFLNEGSYGLWEYRQREAHRYANWGDEKYARYLYEIKK